MTIAAQAASLPADTPRFGTASLLALAAAPTFAIMAAATAVHGEAMPDMICAMAMSHDGSLLGGMTPMYALMSVFHAGPWLKLVARRRSRPDGA